MNLKKDSKANRNLLKEVFEQACAMKRAEKANDSTTFKQAKKDVQKLTTIYQRANRL